MHTDQTSSRILIVDDDADLRTLLRAELEALGHAVSALPDGETALGWLRENPADVVFLDVSMAGLSGLDVLKTIRERSIDVAVILTTAHGSEDVAIKALRFGADDYLRKPFTLTQLHAVLQRTLAKLSAARQTAQLQRQVSRAGAIQAELLPAEFPQMEGWELNARCIPASDVGGDFYDWQEPSPGQLSVTVGDVMGNGMPAALLMASVRAFLRAASPASPAKAVQTAAAGLASDLGRSGSFVTMFHGLLDLATGRLRYVDAGHGYTLLCRADGRTERLPSKSLPIGVLDDEVYAEGEVTLEPGDVLLVHSDGLTEALPELFKAPGRAPFAKLGSATAIAKDLIDRAMSAGPLLDDLTVCALRRTAAVA